MGHYGCAKDTTAEENALAFDDGGGREVAEEDFADGGVFDQGELNAEADGYAED